MAKRRAPEKAGPATETPAKMPDVEVSDVVIRRQSPAFEGFFRIDEYEFSIPRFKGGSLTQTRLVFERGDAAAALVHDLDTDELIFTNQFRMPTYKKGPATLEQGKGWILEIPAGMVRPSESPDNSIRRELMEEIGYEVPSLDFIASFYVSPGGTSERIFTFYAPVRAGDLKNPDASGVVEEGEDIESVRIDRRRCYQMMDEGKLPDAKTIVALQWLRMKMPG